MGMSPRLLRPRQTSRFAALRNGLTNYWPLNETATSGDVTAANWVAGGLNMTSENSVLSTTGIYGNARRFVSANSERMLGNATASSTLFGTADFTVAFWFRMNSAWVSGVSGIITNDFFSTERGVSINTTLYSGPDWTAPYLNLQYSDGTEETWFPASAPPFTAATGTWNFCCVRFTGGTTMDYTFNSSAATTKTITKGFHATRQRLFFGVRYTAADFFDGDLDEVTFWNRRLSNSEVATLYNNGTGIDLAK